MSIHNYKEILNIALSLYIKYNLDKQRKDMLHYVFELTKDTKPDYVQLGEITKIFTNNKIDVNDFVRDVANVLLCKHFKKNCLRIWGGSDSGKTLIANMITKPFITCYLNNHGSENEFYLSNMLNKSIIMCEELYITPATAEDFKSVLGGQMIDTDKKFHDKQLLSRTPVIVTSNYDKFGRGHLARIDEDALSNRCYTYQMYAPCKPAVVIDWEQFWVWFKNLYLQ